MSNSQIEIQLMDNYLKDNCYWKKLISRFAMVGLKFEIHCWREETEEIKAALEFGKKKITDWELGTIIEGIIDDTFINMLHNTTKPSDTKIYNLLKMVFLLNTMGQKFTFYQHLSMMPILQWCLNNYKNMQL